MKTLDTGRLGVSAQAIGVAQGALDEAIKYAKERKQFGRSIAPIVSICCSFPQSLERFNVKNNLSDGTNSETFFASFPGNKRTKPS